MAYWRRTGSEQQLGSHGAKRTSQHLELPYQLRWSLAHRVPRRYQTAKQQLQRPGTVRQLKQRPASGSPRSPWTSNKGISGHPALPYQLPCRPARRPWKCKDTHAVQRAMVQQWSYDVAEAAAKGWGPLRAQGPQREVPLSPTVAALTPCAKTSCTRRTATREPSAITWP